MRFVSIETSCDETSVAVFDERRIVFHEVYSQVPYHRRYKGVVPEIASRLHSEKISAILKKVDLKGIEAVGFTRGPGLKGSLLVGKIVALTIGNLFDIPIIGINHLEGHLLACDIVDDRIEDILKFPLICLCVSGGHTELWYCTSYGRYTLVGKTRDDACGEAFDKVARLLGFDYPGGPQIELAAKKAKRFNVSFTVPDVPSSFDYSFSGIKTQVMYYIRGLSRLTDEIKNEVAFAFQKAVCESLLRKLELAKNRFKVRNIAVCGGVSANKYLRGLVLSRFDGCNIYFPPIKYTSDNAAMIGVGVFRRLQRKRFKNSLEIVDSLPIADWV